MAAMATPMKLTQCLTHSAWPDMKLETKGIETESRMAAISRRIYQLLLSLLLARIPIDLVFHPGFEVF
jgi:hypothetical protein